MKLKLIQNSVGKYYLGSNEEALSFSLAIVDEEGKILRDELGNQALIYYMGEPDYIFDDYLEYMSQVVIKCLDYSIRVWGNTNYYAQCIFFLKLYKENMEELALNKQQELLEKLKKQSEEIQKEIKYLEYFELLEIDLSPKIKQYQGMVDYYQKQLEQLIPDTENYLKNKKAQDVYQRKINDLTNVSM
jgi:hypothetical protein